MQSSATIDTIYDCRRRIPAAKSRRRGGDDSGGGPYLCPDDRYNQKEREFAVDPLQILGLSNFDETDDCYAEKPDDYGSE